ncbi:hypothetical protein PFLUOLIPICF7_22375 [Pseudomonas simiae]|nr:hypothetical protein PFLUOLIPICF7_22375 [Pseudomonas simiae]
MGADPGMHLGQVDGTKPSTAKCLGDGKPWSADSSKQRGQLFRLTAFKFNKRGLF